MKLAARLLLHSIAEVTQKHDFIDYIRTQLRGIYAIAQPIVRSFINNYRFETSLDVNNLGFSQSLIGYHYILNKILFELILFRNFRKKENNSLSELFSLYFSQTSVVFVYHMYFVGIGLKKNIFLLRIYVYKYKLR